MDVTNTQTPVKMIQTFVRKSLPLWTVAGALSIVPALSAQETHPLPIPVGTRVSIVTTSMISSKDHKKGNKLTLEVTDSVVVNGRTVIAKGAPIWGVVGEVKKAGRQGKDGLIVLSIDSVKTVDGKTVALVVNMNDASALADINADIQPDMPGKKSTRDITGIPGLEQAKVIQGFLKKGDDVTIDANSRIPAFTASYVVLALTGAAPVFEIDTVSANKDKEALARAGQVIRSNDASVNNEPTQTAEASAAKSDEQAAMDSIPPNPQAILLVNGVETWGRSLGALTSALGSTPQIRALGEKMMKDHGAVQASLFALVKKHNMEIPLLAPADEKQLNDVLRTLRTAKSEDFDKIVMDRVQGLSSNVIATFGEGGAPGMDALIVQLVKVWMNHGQTAQGILGNSRK